MINASYRAPYQEIDEELARGRGCQAVESNIRGLKVYDIKVRRKGGCQKTALQMPVRTSATFSAADGSCPAQPRRKPTLRRGLPVALVGSWSCCIRGRPSPPSRCSAETSTSKG